MSLVGTLEKSRNFYFLIAIGEKRISDRAYASSRVDHKDDLTERALAIAISMPIEEPVCLEKHPRPRRSLLWLPTPWLFLAQAPFHPQNSFHHPM